MQNLITLLTQKTTLHQNQITNILKLLDEGSTIPFIARYRKEMTGGATDVTFTKSICRQNDCSIEKRRLSIY